MHDVDFKDVMQNCKEGRTWNKFILNDGFVFRANKLCIPASFVRLLLLQEAHGGGLMGHFTTKNTLLGWYMFVTVGHVFYHACTSMTILRHDQDSHTCAVVEVFHDIIKIIITEVSASMTINGASWKCFR